MQGAWVWSLVGEDPTCRMAQPKKKNHRVTEYGHFGVSWPWLKYFLVLVLASSVILGNRLHLTVLQLLLLSNGPNDNHCHVADKVAVKIKWGTWYWSPGPQDRGRCVTGGANSRLGVPETGHHLPAAWAPRGWCPTSRALPVSVENVMQPMEERWDGRVSPTV